MSCRIVGRFICPSSSVTATSSLGKSTMIVQLVHHEGQQFCLTDKGPLANLSHMCCTQCSVFEKKNCMSRDRNEHPKDWFGETLQAHCGFGAGSIYTPVTYAVRTCLSVA